MKYLKNNKFNHVVKKVAHNVSKCITGCIEISNEIKW